jgi:hypothetical protein
MSGAAVETKIRGVPSFWADPSERSWNLWGYVDRARQVLGFEPRHTWCDYLAAGPGR